VTGVADGKFRGIEELESVEKLDTTVVVVEDVGFADSSTKVVAIDLKDSVMLALLLVDPDNSNEI
jgi:hypothetical protein